MRRRSILGLRALLAGCLASACRGEAPREDAGPSTAPAAATPEPSPARVDASTASPPRPGPPPPWTLPTTESPALRVFFADDGRRLITAEAAGLLRVWDLERRGPPVMLSGHLVAVEVVALAADGRLLVSAAGDGTLQLWFLEDGLSLDPAAAASDARRRPTIPGAFNPPVPLPGAQGRVLDLALDPRGRRVAAGTDAGAAHLWSIDAPTLPPRTLTHAAAVERVVFDGAGARLLTLARGLAPRIWSVDGEGGPRLLGADGPPRAYVHAAFAADDDAVALLTTTGAIETWPVDGGGPPSITPAPATSPAAADLVAIWGPFGPVAADAPAGRIWPAAPERGRFPAAAWPASDRVVVVDDGGTRLLGRDGGARALRLDGPPIDVAFTADGLRLATLEASGRVRVWRSGIVNAP